MRWRTDRDAAWQARPRPQLRRLPQPCLSSPGWRGREKETPCDSTRRKPITPIRSASPRNIRVTFPAPILQRARFDFFQRWVYGNRKGIEDNVDADEAMPRKLVIRIPTRIAVTAFSRAWPRTSGRSTSTPGGSCALSRCCTTSTGTFGTFIKSMRRTCAAMKDDLRGSRRPSPRHCRQKLLDADRLERSGL